MNNNNIKKNDEIDIIDIIAVIIKWKWIVIIIVILSLILTLYYIKAYKQKKANYLISFNIYPPETYEIKKNFLLDKKSVDSQLIKNEIIEKLSLYKLKNKDISFTGNYDKKNNVAKINISASKFDKAKNTTIYLYKIYTNYLETIKLRSENIYKWAQKSIDQEINQKEELIKMISNNLNKNKKIINNENINGTLIYLIEYINDNISILKKTKILNNQLELSNGIIELVSNSKRLVLNKNTISTIASYIKNESLSKKKQILILFISVFLALFVGIFLAFVVEFFSREDVKARLKAASKK